MRINKQETDWPKADLDELRRSEAAACSQAQENSVKKLNLKEFPTYLIDQVNSTKLESITEKSFLDVTTHHPDFKFQNRSIIIENPDLVPEKSLCCGKVDLINSLFFPKKMNKETALILEIVRELIQNLSTDKVHFEFPEFSGYFCTNVEETKIVYKGTSHLLYDLLKKVKWDLIEFDNETLDGVNLDLLDVWSSGTTNGREGTEHLYDRLHQVEKCIIKSYTSSSHAYNKFLRVVSLHKAQVDQNHFKQMLVKVAIMCSGLNKIPESQNVKQSGYVYRCLENARRTRDLEIIDYYEQCLNEVTKAKELGFTGVSYSQANTSFLSSGSGEKDCILIFVNPNKLAKDISGLSTFPEEHECLFLPNTKSYVLRKVEYPIKRKNRQPNDKRALLISQLTSKRLGVF